jgi:hypothetical protein
VPDAGWCSGVRERGGERGKSKGAGALHGICNVSTLQTKRLARDGKTLEYLKNRAGGCLIQAMIKLAVCVLPPGSTVIDTVLNVSFIQFHQMYVDKCLVAY